MLVERVWAQLKHEWGKQLAKVTTTYNHDNMTRDVELICGSVRDRLTPNILSTANKDM